MDFYISTLLKSCIQSQERVACLFRWKSITKQFHSSPNKKHSKDKISRVECRDPYANWNMPERQHPVVLKPFPLCACVFLHSRFVQVVV